MRGRPPKPTRLKQLEGTLRKDRQAGGASLEPPPAIPACPAWIKGDAREEWDRIVPQLAALGVLTGLDGAALEHYCNARGRWREADRDLSKKRKGVPANMIPGPFGPITNPNVKIAFNERKEASRLGGLLGLDPSGRVRLKAPEKKPTAPDDDGIPLFGAPLRAIPGGSVGP